MASLAPSPVSSRAASLAPSPVSPHAQSIAPSPERSRSPECFQDAADEQEEVEEEEYDSEAEEEDMERFLDMEDADPVTTARDEI